VLFGFLANVAVLAASTADIFDRRRSRRAARRQWQTDHLDARNLPSAINQR
jgi:hypothetical protein